MLEPGLVETGNQRGRRDHRASGIDVTVPHLAALAILLAGDSTPGRGNRSLVQATGPADAAALIDRLRADGVVLIYDPGDRTLRAGDARSVTIGMAAIDTRPRRNKERRAA